MKLELKHLAGYLPYGLKIHKNTVTELNIHNLSFVLSYCQPILRPLSDLTKEIEVNGEKFITIERLTKTYNHSIGNVAKIDFHNIDGFTLYGTLLDDSYEISMPYSFYEQILSWHFDIYGLIESGLAIDINTLSK